MLAKLVKLADHLDSKKLYKLADRVDLCIAEITDNNWNGIFGRIMTEGFGVLQKAKDAFAQGDIEGGTKLLYVPTEAVISARDTLKKHSFATNPERNNCIRQVNKLENGINDLKKQHNVV